MVSGSIQLQRNREQSQRTEYNDGRNQPQIGAQLFSLPLWPHRNKIST